MNEQRYIIQIEDRLLGVLIGIWIDSGKPCPLLFRRPKTEGLTAIELTARTRDDYDFLNMAILSTQLKLYER